MKHKVETVINVDTEMNKVESYGLDDDMYESLLEDHKTLQKKYNDLLSKLKSK